MKLSLFSVSYAGLWGQHALDVPAFIARAARLGYEAVMLAGKRPHLSPLDATEKHLGQIAVALEELSRRASHLSVPLMFSQRLFILKSHIALAQAEVEKRRRAGTAGAAASPPEQRREVSWPALPRGR